MEEHIKFYEPPRLTPTNRVQLHRVRENNETIEDVRKGYMEHARMIFMINPDLTATTSIVAPNRHCRAPGYRQIIHTSDNKKKRKIF
jgi:hypothetical protein